MVRFHVLGDALVDVLCGGLAQLPALEGDATAEHIALRVGGSALNTAVHLASLGPGRVTFYASVGKDAFADMLTARLQSVGIEAWMKQTLLQGRAEKHLGRLIYLYISRQLQGDALEVKLQRHSEKSTGSCVILSGPSLGRSFVTCYGAAPELDVHIHLGGVYSYGPTLRRALPSFLQRCRAAAASGLTVSLDANGHEVNQLEGVRALLPEIDLFKGNVTEVEALMGLAWPDAMAEVTGQGCAAVITCGAEGAHWRLGSASGTATSPRVVSLDSTGAGDATCAALLARWSSGEDLQSATAFACAAGAWNCETPATEAPQLNEAELFQAIHFASYPRRVTDVQIVVYANKHHKNLDLLQHHAPFPVKILRQAQLKPTEKAVSGLPFLAMFSVICSWSSLALLAGAINPSQTENLHVPSQPSQPRRHAVPMQATVLAEGDTQVLMRKENVSDIDTRSCTCTDVDLKGKKWSPGGLKKCVGNCKKVSKSTEVNDCPKDWKIFSPRSKEDWETIISLDDVLKPHLVVDVTQDKAGCGGCTQKAMNSDEDGQSMWKTLDGSAWWLSASPYLEPNGHFD
eukprot:s1661_g4.t5